MELEESVTVDGRRGPSGVELRVWDAAKGILILCCICILHEWWLDHPRLKLMHEPLRKKKKKVDEKKNSKFEPIMEFGTLGLLSREHEMVTKV